MKILGSTLHISRPSSMGVGAMSALQGRRAIFTVDVSEPGTSMFALDVRF